jgi:hypothetical protein
VTIDGTNYVCADPCNAGQCSTGFTCRGSGTNSYCFPATAPAPGGKSGGCAAAPLDPVGTGGGRSSLPVAGLSLALFAGGRRLGRARRAART